MVSKAKTLVQIVVCFNVIALYKCISVTDAPHTKLHPNTENFNEVKRQTFGYTTSIVHDSPDNGGHTSKPSSEMYMKLYGDSNQDNQHQQHQHHQQQQDLGPNLFHAANPVQEHAFNQNLHHQASFNRPNNANDNHFDDTNFNHGRVKDGRAPKYSALKGQPELITVDSNVGHTESDYARDYLKSRQGFRYYPGTEGSNHGTKGGNYGSGSVGNSVGAAGGSSVGGSGNTFNVGYSIGFEDGHNNALPHAEALTQSQPLKSYQVQKPHKERHSFKNSDIVRGTPTDKVERPHSLNFNGPKDSRPVQFLTHYDAGNYAQTEHPQLKTYAKGYSKQKSTYKKPNWRTVSPNVEFASSAVKKLPVQVQSNQFFSNPALVSFKDKPRFQEYSPPQNGHFNHDQVLANSEGFDYSNAINFDGHFSPANFRNLETFAKHGTTPNFEIKTSPSFELKSTTKPIAHRQTKSPPSFSRPSFRENFGPELNSEAFKHGYNSDGLQYDGNMFQKSLRYTGKPKKSKPDNIYFPNNRQFDHVPAASNRYFAHDEMDSYLKAAKENYLNIEAVNHVGAGQSQGQFGSNHFDRSEHIPPHQDSTNHYFTDSQIRDSHQGHESHENDGQMSASESQSFFTENLPEYLKDYNQFFTQNDSQVNEHGRSSGRSVRVAKSLASHKFDGLDTNLRPPPVSSPFKIEA